MEKIILCDVQIEVYPDMEKSLLDMIHNSGYPAVKFEKKDNYFIGLVLIPKKDMSKVKRGQNVEIYLKNVNKLVFKSNLCEISKKHTINDDIRFYRAEICKIEGLSIIKETEGIAVIITNKISFFERIVSVFESM